LYTNKKVLVAGGTGTIGIPLVSMLLEMKAHVTVVSIDTPENARAIFGERISYIQKDLTLLDNCLAVTRGQDYVFNLVGIKGSTGIGETKVASYLVPMLWFQTNLMEASFRNSVKRYLFVSSVCGYPQATIPKEEDTFWDGMPKQNDRIPGIAKRVGEVQGEAYLHEYGWDAVRIVRPSNVYGPHDDFNPATAQVIPSLIRRIADKEDPLTVWGDGSAMRDFIYTDDVAHWMLVALEKAPPCVPINLGSGKGLSIKELVDVIQDCFPEQSKVVWDTEKPTGDPARILSIKRATETIGFETITDIRKGIANTVAWYLKNRDVANEQKRRYGEK
jgi:GDP-L-fucose synthase